MAMDYAKARTAMVESQIRPADVTDPAVVAALRAIPREHFVPAALQAVAYADAEIDLGQGRYLLRPRHLGKLLQALEPQPGEKALELASGTGYGASVLDVCGLSVTMLEPNADLLPAARVSLEAADRCGVAVASTPLAMGWAQGAPYDLMILNGAAEVVPEVWLAQLSEGGRLGVIVRQGRAGSARLYRRERGVVSFRTVFDASPPVLADLASPQAFQF